MKIAVPVEEENGMDSKVCEHFGQTPFWAMYDTESKDLSIKKKESQHGGGGCTAIDEVMQDKPDMLFVLGMGWNAIHRCSDEGIVVKTGPFYTMNEIVSNLDKLEDMTHGCK